jgi:hypothetical protein
VDLAEVQSFLPAAGYTPIPSTPGATTATVTAIVGYQNLLTLRQPRHGVLEQRDFQQTRLIPGECASSPVQGGTARMLRGRPQVFPSGRVSSSFGSSFLRT